MNERRMNKCNIHKKQQQQPNEEEDTQLIQLLSCANNYCTYFNLLVFHLLVAVFFPFSTPSLIQSIHPFTPEIVKFDYTLEDFARVVLFWLSRFSFSSSKVSSSITALKIPLMRTFSLFLIYNYPTSKQLCSIESLKIEKDGAGDIRDQCHVQECRYRDTLRKN